MNARAKKWFETAKTIAKMKFYTDMTPSLPTWDPSWRDTLRASSLQDKTWRIWVSAGWRVGPHPKDVCHPSTMRDDQAVRAMTLVMVLQFRKTMHVFILGKRSFHHFLQYLLHVLGHPCTNCNSINRFIKFSFFHRSFFRIYFTHWEIIAS